MWMGRGNFPINNCSKWGLPANKCKRPIRCFGGVQRGGYRPGNTSDENLLAGFLMNLTLLIGKLTFKTEKRPLEMTKFDPPQIPVFCLFLNLKPRIREVLHFWTWGISKKTFSH